MFFDLLESDDDDHDDDRCTGSETNVSVGRETSHPEILQDSLSFTEITLCTCILTVMSKPFEKKNSSELETVKHFPVMNSTCNYRKSVSSLQLRKYTLIQITHRRRNIGTNTNISALSSLLTELSMSLSITL